MLNHYKIIPYKIQLEFSVISSVVSTQGIHLLFFSAPTFEDLFVWIFF